MVIPDWLYKLFVALGLVDSEKKKIKKMIAAYQEEIRRLNDALQSQIGEIRDIDREISKLKTKYEEAQGPAQSAYAEMIKPLLQKRKSMEEQQAVIGAQLKTVTALLAKAEIMEKAPANEARTGEIADMTDRMEDLNDILNEQSEGLKDLERASYKTKDSTPLELNEPENAIDDEFEKELAAFVSSSEPAPRESAEEKTEA